MAEEIPRKVAALPLKEKRFIPETGNPENGDYLDWYRRLKQAEVVELRRDKTKAP